MSDISLLRATPMHPHLSPNLIHAAKIDIVRRSAFHAGCRKDRSSFCIPCSRVRRTWKTSQEADSKNTFKLFCATLAKTQVRLLSAQLIVVQREFPRTHKYDSDMEILLNARQKLLRIPFIRASKKPEKSATNFVCSNVIL